MLIGNGNQNQQSYAKIQFDNIKKTIDKEMKDVSRKWHYGCAQNRDVLLMRFDLIWRKKGNFLNPYAACWLILPIQNNAEKAPQKLLKPWHMVLIW